MKLLTLIPTRSVKELLSEKRINSAKQILRKWLFEKQTKLLKV
jgi:hypothetical protein